MGAAGRGAGAGNRCDHVATSPPRDIAKNALLRWRVFVYWTLLGLFNALVFFFGAYFVFETTTVSSSGQVSGEAAGGRGRGCSGGRAGSPPVAGQPALSAAPGDGGRGLSARWRAGSASSRGALRRRVQTGFVTWVSLLATRQHSGVRGHVGIIRFFRPFGLCPASPSAPVSLVTRRFVDVGETPGSSGRWRHCRGV